jgi:hypothetical protein
MDPQTLYICAGYKILQKKDIKQFIPLDSYFTTFVGNKFWDFSNLGEIIGFL